MQANNWHWRDWESEYPTRWKSVEVDRHLSTLREEVNALKSTRSSLHDKIQSASTSIPVAIVATPALPPPTPMKPRKMLNMAVAGVLSGFLSVLIVFFVDYWKSQEVNAPTKSVPENR